MKDDQKTKAQLLAEIEQLRSQLADNATSHTKSRQPTLGQDITRRSALKIAWVAPVVLSLPITAAVPRRLAAQAPPSMPTILPPSIPTRMPTGAPTRGGPGGPNPPTAFPSAVEAPVLSNAAVAAAAGALFGIGAKKLMDHSEDDGNSEDGGDE